MRVGATTQRVTNAVHDVAGTIYWNYLVDVVGTGVETIVRNQILDTKSFRNYCSPNRVYPLTDDVSGLNSEWQREIQPTIPEGVPAFDTTPWEFTEPFVSEVENVTLIGPHSVAVTEDKKIIADTLTFDSNKRMKIALSRAVFDNPFNTLRTLQTGQPARIAKPIDRAIILNGGWINYYHWIVEHLAKLRALNHYEEITGLSAKIILPEEPASYMTQSLEMAGISSEMWLNWPGDQMVVDKLVVPSYPEITPGVLKWLREAILSSELNDSTSPKRVFVSRQKAKKRRVRNYRPLKGMLEKHGFVTMFTEDLPFEEQVRIFYNADVIVGPHGAGLTNILWGDDLTVLELFPNCIKSPYYALSELLGHTYEAVICDETGEADKKPNRDMIVDISGLEDKMKEIGIL